MSVSFAMHQKSIVDAYNQVIDDKDELNWALFSYKANNELYLEETGDGGLEELESEFNSGKMQYAFVSITDPNTKMTKYLLIIWQGEGVPATRKGSCANHVRDVKHFFKNHHIAIVARNEDEVQADEIMKTVLKTTSNFTYVAPSSNSDPHQSVSSVYKPIKPIEEVKSIRNQQFWNKVQQEEESRLDEEKRLTVIKDQHQEKRLKEEHIRSEENRKKLENQRAKEINEKLKAQQIADDNKDFEFNEKNQLKSGHIEQHGTSHTRLLWQERESGSSQLLDQEKAHEEQQPESFEAAIKKFEDNEQIEVISQKDNNRESFPNRSITVRALYDYQAADDTELSFDPDDFITNVDQIDEGWWQGTGPDGSFGLFPANYVEIV